MKTLKDYGLDRKDSMRAQRIFEHQDLIPVVVAKAEESKDLPTLIRRSSGFSTKVDFNWFTVYGISEAVISTTVFNLFVNMCHKFPFS